MTQETPGPETPPAGDSADAVPPDTNGRTAAAIRWRLEAATLAALEVDCLPEHPERLAQRDRLEAFRAVEAEREAAGEPLDLDAVRAALEAAGLDSRVRLAELGVRYGAEHPEVRRETARQEALTGALAALGTEATPGGEP